MLMSLFFESETFTKLFSSTEQVSGNQLGGYGNFLLDFLNTFFIQIILFLSFWFPALYYLVKGLLIRIPS